MFKLTVITFICHIPLVRSMNNIAKYISFRDKYLFDLNGFLIVRNVFSLEEVIACNKAIDKHVDYVQERSNVELRNTKAGTPLVGNGISGRKDLGAILEWGPESQLFRAVLNHPILVPYYHEFLGTGYRMDHQPFCILQDAGSEGFSLHGGTIDFQTGEYNPHLAYSCVQGRINNQLLAVSVALSDHNKGDGGFVVVRGSHKSNFAVPDDIINGIDDDYIDQPITKAGDVILFSEGTVHGARPWTASHQRRIALFRFSPATACYGRSYYPTWPEGMLRDLSEEQRAVLEPPYSVRLDRPTLSSDGSIEICSRSPAKKEFDRRVFGTPYF